MYVTSCIHTLSHHGTSTRSFHRKHE